MHEVDANSNSRSCTLKHQEQQHNQRLPAYLISAPLCLLEPKPECCSVFIQQYQVEPLDPLGLAI
jgi:hypothetical protein